MRNYAGVLAAAFAVLAASGAAIAQNTLALRGTSSAFPDQIEASTVPDGSGLDRKSTGSIVRLRPTHADAMADPEYSDHLPAAPYQDDRDGLLHDMRSTVGLVADTLIPLATLRGMPRPELARDVPATIPERAALRHSMMHSANLYDGLRGGTASVADSVSLALRGSYSTREKLERANAARANTHLALTNFLPRVEGTLSHDIAPATSGTSRGRQESATTMGVSVSMPLFTSGVNVNTYRQARHLGIAADYSYLAEEHRVALEAVAAHINLRLNRRIEQTLRKNVGAMEKLEDVARRLYEAGDASRTDIAIAEANVESARSEFDLARRSREEVLADYESLTANRAPADLAVKGVERFVPPTLEAAFAMARRNNPKLKAARHEAVAARHSAKVALGEFGPRVDLYAGYDEDLYSTRVGNTDSRWNVGIKLKIPLFDAGLAPSVAAAQSSALERGYRAQDEERRILLAVRRQWTAVRSAERRMDIVRRQVAAIERSVEGARREYEAGFRAITDVLNDQVKLARARITLETTRHERLLAAYELAFTAVNPALKTLPGITDPYTR